MAPARVATPAIVLFELETGTAKSAEADKRINQLAERVSYVRYRFVIAMDSLHAGRRWSSERHHCPPILTISGGISGGARNRTCQTTGSAQSLQR